MTSASDPGRPVPPHGSGPASVPRPPIVLAVEVSRDGRTTRVMNPRARLLLASAAVLAMAGSLGACATPSPQPVQTVTVKVATPVSCVPRDYPPAPAKPVPTREQLLAAGDAAARYQLLGQFWNDWAPRISLDEATIVACQRAAPAP